MIKKYLKQLFCKHDFELTLDERGNSKISRHCVFTCKKCGEMREFRRWAFYYTSGAMICFLGKAWPITWLPDYHERYEKMMRAARPIWTKAHGVDTTHPHYAQLKKDGVLSRQNLENTGK